LNDLDLAAVRALERRVAGELGCHVTGWSRIAGGTNNRLYRLDTREGRALLVKHYQPDEWQRLDREFATLACLRRQRIGFVPRALLRDDAAALALYSLEAGAVSDVTALRPDDGRAIAARAAALHTIVPGSAGCGPRRAIGACFTLAGQIAGIERRLASFAEFAAGAVESAAVRTLCREVDLSAEVQRLIAGVTARFDAADLTAPVAEQDRRLNSGDFGPHNLLLHAEAGITVLDWEWSGWDDPARMVMGFVAHAASEGLAPEAADAFLAAYAEARALPESEKARYERVGLLYDVEWVAVYSGVLTPAITAGKRFADANFDVESRNEALIERLRARLARAAAGRGYPFPR